MAANRFTRFQPQQYQSVYVPLPFEEIMQVGANKQKIHDNVETATNSILDAFLNVKAIDGTKDVELRNQKVSEFKKEFDTKLAESGGDYASLLPWAKQYARKVKEDLAYGTLGAVQKSYNQYQEYVKQLDDLYEKGKIDIDQREKLQLKSYYEYRDKGGIGDKDQFGSYKSFNGDRAAEFQDIPKAAMEQAQGWIADSVRRGGIVQTTINGVTAYKTTDGSEKIITFDEVYNNVLNSLKSNPKIMAYAKQKRDLDMYGTPTDEAGNYLVGQNGKQSSVNPDAVLEQYFRPGVEAAANKVAHRETSYREYGLTFDPMSTWKAKRAATKKELESGLASPTRLSSPDSPSTAPKELDDLFDENGYIKLTESKTSLNSPGVWGSLAAAFALGPAGALSTAGSIGGATGLGAAGMSGGFSETRNKEVKEAFEKVNKLAQGVGYDIKGETERTVRESNGKIGYNDALRQNVEKVKQIYTQMSTKANHEIDLTPEYQAYYTKEVLNNPTNITVREKPDGPAIPLSEYMANNNIKVTFNANGQPSTKELAVTQYAPSAGNGAMTIMRFAPDGSSQKLYIDAPFEEMKDFFKPTNVASDQFNTYLKEGKVDKQTEGVLKQYGLVTSGVKLGTPESKVKGFFKADETKTEVSALGLIGKDGQYIMADGSKLTGASDLGRMVQFVVQAPQGMGVNVTRVDKAALEVLNKGVKADPKAFNYVAGSLGLPANQLKKYLAEGNTQAKLAELGVELTKAGLLQTGAIDNIRLQDAAAWDNSNYMKSPREKMLEKDNYGFDEEPSIYVPEDQE